MPIHARPTTGLLAVAALGLGLATPAAASRKSWDDASSAATGVLVAAALAAPSVQQDWHGTLQAGESIGIAYGMTLGLKEMFPETRPDHSDRNSFPSGHASAGFAAAATIQNRYGWQVAVPAQLLAVFVAVGRVKADQHHWYDVAASAAIGEATGFLVTSRHDAGVQVVPWADSHGGGMSAALRF